MANSRVARGRKTQRLIAEWFKKYGWEDAKSVEASLPGVDIQNMLTFAPEVKATRDGSLTGAVKQAVKNAEPGQIPLVVWRPDGYGEERIGEWLVVFTLADATRLMAKWDDRCAHMYTQFDRSVCECGKACDHCDDCGWDVHDCTLEKLPRFRELTWEEYRDNYLPESVRGRQ